jgi:hypothetical protein
LLIWAAGSMRGDIQPASWSISTPRPPLCFYYCFYQPTPPRPDSPPINNLYVTYVTDAWRKTGQKSAE